MADGFGMTFVFSFPVGMLRWFLWLIKESVGLVGTAVGTRPCQRLRVKQCDPEQGRRRIPLIGHCSKIIAKYLDSISDRLSGELTP